MSELKHERKHKGNVYKNGRGVVNEWILPVSGDYLSSLFFRRVFQYHIHYIPNKYRAL